MTAPPTVAAFDLDGTLTEGGSVFKWLTAIAGLRTTYGAAGRLAVPLAVGGLLSGLAADRAKERLFRALLHDRDLEAVQSASRDFVREHLARHSRELSVQRLRWHQSQGHEVVIVSASPEIYVRVVAEHLGVQGALGTRLAVAPSGRLEGGYDGHNCRGEEKMRRLRAWIEERHDSIPVEVWAYGNSRGDRRLLDFAQRPYNVGRLGRWGALRAFPSLNSPDPTDESRGPVR